MIESRDLYDQLASAATTQEPDEAAAAMAAAPAVILYGAGNAGGDVLRVLLARGITVRCFLDRNATPGSERGGIPIFHPDDPAFGPEARQTVLVIITVFNYQVNEGALRVELKCLGWTSVVPFVSFHRTMAIQLGNRYWLTDLTFYSDRAPQLRAAAALWADDRSRAIYDAVLRYRLQGEEGSILAPDTDCSYFPVDVPPWSTPARFIDCGAYDGDTLEQIRERHFPLAAIAAFEPDSGYVSKLSATLRDMVAGSEVAEALCWPCAVHSSTTQLRFAEGLGMASGIRADGGTVVQAVAIDDVAAGFRPTLIKMDIEGAEYDGLLGARNTIRQHRPGLAICVYHRPQHLWQIPLLLASWQLDYRFWLRIHGHSGHDLVLYAQPI